MSTPFTVSSSLLSCQPAPEAAPGYNPSGAMSYVADLHIHSLYAMGTSPQLTLENLDSWARVKGIDLSATRGLHLPRLAGGAPDEARR